jgi:hypothetical protein
VSFVVLEEPTCARDQGTAGREASRGLSIVGRSSDCEPMRVVGSLEPRDRIGAAADLDGVKIEGPSQPLHFISSSAGDRRQDSLDRAGTPPCVEDINVTIHGETLQTRPPAGGQHREYLGACPGRQSRRGGMPPVQVWVSPVSRIHPDVRHISPMITGHVGVLGSLVGVDPTGPWSAIRA